jgi:hypothetical protein
MWRFNSLALMVALLAGCSSRSDNDSPAPPMANTPPTVAGIADRTINQDTVVGPIEFSVADRESVPTALTVRVQANDTAVFPADGLVLAGSGTVRTLTLTPLEAATGSAVVTVTITDPEGAASTRVFSVTVNARAASVRETTLATFAKGEGDDPTDVNGVTFAQDADDQANFASLIPPEDEP